MTPSTPRPPRLLTIAGSDSGGGAGIQADLKAFARCGAHGMTAITAITAQNTVEVRDVYPLPPDAIVAQVAAVAEDIGVDAVKIGMLGTAETIEAVERALDLVGDVPVVLDPVMVAESGAVLLDGGAGDALRDRLLPRATVVTPNLLEAQALAGRDGSRRDLAERIHELGAPAVVVTGGHGEDSVDHLFDGERHVEIRVRRYDVAATHGAGCTHSATLAALLAHGLSLEEAARGAAEAAAEAVRNGLAEIGAGEGPVDILSVKERHGDHARRDAARAARA